MLSLPKCSRIPMQISHVIAIHAQFNGITALARFICCCYPIQLCCYCCFCLHSLLLLLTFAHTWFMKTIYTPYCQLLAFSTEIFPYSSNSFDVWLTECIIIQRLIRWFDSWFALVESKAIFGCLQLFVLGKSTHCKNQSFPKKCDFFRKRSKSVK